MNVRMHDRGVLEAVFFCSGQPVSKVKRVVFLEGKPVLQGM